MLTKPVLTTLRRLVGTLRDDLIQQFRSDPELVANLKADHHQLRELDRTGLNYVDWSNGVAEQGAVAWVLTCVFVRWLEDNGWLQQPRLSGRRDRLAQAMDRQRVYLRDNPTHGETQYLLSLFEELADAPTGDVFRPEHTPAYALPISTAGARTLLQVLRAPDPASDTGDAALLFEADGVDTRVLGDLYQDLSEYAKDQYALLQTPDFVEAYLLEHTLEPALDTFGLDGATMIDPTCGSGHLVLGAFRMLFERCRQAAPHAPATDHVNRALELVHGVDINPFAVAIARFRLLLAASWYDCGGQPVDWSRLRPFELNIGCADALLGPVRAGQRSLNGALGWKPKAFLGENQLGFDLLAQEYAVVVGNPPYITPKDPHLRETYRQIYTSCSGKYSLVVPFVQRFFELARLSTDMGQGSLSFDRAAKGAPRQHAGYVGAIVANSFAKREFGKKLVQEYLPTVDLTHIVDTSGAYIPGHGTPTIILFGRHRFPTFTTVRAVLGTRGEPSLPADPGKGVVWRSIADHTGTSGFENEYISVVDMARQTLAQHPWTLRGGGALEALARIQQAKSESLESVASEMGVLAVTGTDDVFVLGDHSLAKRKGICLTSIVGFAVGDGVRDWEVRSDAAISPEPSVRDDRAAVHYAWPYRAVLEQYIYFGKVKAERGLHWLDYGIVMWERYRTPLTITFAFVATHNHFVLDRGGKVFKQTAPIIKLPADATVDDHLRLIGLLNSSVGNFWCRSYCFNKDETDEPWMQRLERDSTKLRSFPLPANPDLLRPAELDRLATELAALEPAALVAQPNFSVEQLNPARQRWAALRGQMIALQEELDWLCYDRYGLSLGAAPLPIASDAQVAASELPPVALGERAFEIVLARKMADGVLTTQWFERHGSTPRATIPAHWPAWYQALVQRRIDALQADSPQRFVRLIEDCEFKRRWNDTPWPDRERAALRSWMLDWLESTAVWPHADRSRDTDAIPPRVRSVRALARLAQNHPLFADVAGRYADQTAPDMLPLVHALVTDQSVPLLPAQRLKPGGLRKFREWERVWALQRREDAIDARTALPADHPDHLSVDAAAALKRQEIGTLRPAPQYTGADFASATWYSLRGKLDVPRERFFVLPGIAIDGGTAAADKYNVAVGWAGWNAEQRMRALVELDQQALAEGGPADQRQMLLAGILDQLPWVEQWHNDPDDFGTRPAELLRIYVRDHCPALGCTLDDLDTLRAGDTA
jgi:hypothetical protein